MEPLLFVMAILGCGESDAPCREVAVAEARYRSEAQCLAASENELGRFEDLPYPAVVAQCRRADDRSQLLRGSQVTLPEAPSANPFNRPQLAAARAGDAQPGR